MLYCFFGKKGCGKSVIGNIILKVKCFEFKNLVVFVILKFFKGFM